MAIAVKSPCGPCCGPAIGTITCVSRQGNGNLRGWSKFQNHNSGDWNTRKCTDFTLTQDSNFYSIDIYTSASCVGFKGSYYQYVYAQNGAWNVTTNVQSTKTRYAGGSTCGYSEGPFDITGLGFGSSDFSALGSTSDFVKSRATVAADFGCSGSSGICTPNASKRTYRSLSTRTLTFLAFDTVSAALARGSPTVGSACKTAGGSSIGSTTAESSTQIAITGPTSVEATIPITGLTVSTAYIVTVKINRYTAGGGSYVDFIYDTIEFTAGATTEDITYDVPVNTDYDYELDTSYKSIAAA